MLDFCAEHDVMPDCETIDIQGVNAAYERLFKGQVNRFVIDVASIQADRKAA